MAKLKKIKFLKSNVSESLDVFLKIEPTAELNYLSVIFNKDSTLWELGSTFLAYRGEEVLANSLDIKTVQNLGWHLLAYLNFCEEEALDPMVFGLSKVDKPTYLYKSRLISQKNHKRQPYISAKTASARIKAVVQFYQWTMECGFLSVTAAPYKVIHSAIYINNGVGLTRRVNYLTTDLRISARENKKETVEGGLIPVSRIIRDQFIQTAYKYSTEEYALMLDLGFRTGMRIQTICGLTLTAINEAAVRDTPGIFYIKVGPRHNVPTKKDINYEAMIPEALLNKLKQYATSTKRLLRLSKNLVENKDLLFINKFGISYNQRDKDQSGFIYKELSRLKAHLPKTREITRFYFHCSRATFGTLTLLGALDAGIKLTVALKLVSDLLGHADLRTTMTYLAFVENERAMDALEEELANG